MVKLLVIKNSKACRREKVLEVLVELVERTANYCNSMSRVIGKNGKLTGYTGGLNIKVNC